MSRCRTLVSVVAIAHSFSAGRLRPSGEMPWIPPATIALRHLRRNGLAHRIDWTSDGRRAAGDAVQASLRRGSGRARAWTTCGGELGVGGHGISARGGPEMVDADDRKGPGGQDDGCIR